LYADLSKKRNKIKRLMFTLEMFQEESGQIQVKQINQGLRFNQRTCMGATWG
jgi:hypothetical protein